MVSWIWSLSDVKAELSKSQRQELIGNPDVQVAEYIGDLA
jgi:hypothetical protein